MQVDLGGRGLQPALEGAVLVADRFPVVGNLTDRPDIKTGVALCMRQRLDDGAEAGLRGAAGKGVHRGVDGADPRIGGGEDRGARDTGGVMGVEMDRPADLFPKRLEKDARGGGLQQPRHVLEPEHMHVALHQLGFGHAVPHGLDMALGRAAEDLVEMIDLDAGVLRHERSPGASAAGGHRPG